MKSLLFLINVAGVIVIIAGCKPKIETKASSPSGPAKVISENDLSSVVLKPKAEKRLGIQTAPVTLQKIGRNRTLGGELLLPLGRPAEKSDPGSSSNKSIYSILPALTAAELVRIAEMQVDADGQVAAAKVQLEGAKVALMRAENLVANNAGTQRAMDETKAQAQLAEAALKTARERRALLGTPVFDAVRKDVLWVRVPIYAGDFDRVNRTAPARISNLGDGPDKSPRVAQPVDVPFSPATTSASVDLFYELNNANGALKPGQKVSVAIPLEGETESMVVPATAVLHDIHGGTWVYENTAPQKYTRRRVEVRFTSDVGAVLARGPQPGAKIVTAGAAELFGAEFGIGGQVHGTEEDDE